MTVKRNIFDVEYLDAPDRPREFRVRVIMSDRLMAEVHGRKYGLVDAQEQPNLTGALWLFFACLREGHVPAETEFKTFQERCLDNTKVGDEDVPPTEATERPSSSSVASSPASTGVHGTTTTD